MKFRRKSSPGSSEEVEETPAEPATGPFDADEMAEDGVERIDLGSLLIAPSEGRELRLQVDETSGQVQAVMLTGPDGMLELRAFAAPRHGDLWSDVRKQISSEIAQQGGAVEEREGRFGPELACRMNVKAPDGAPAVQPSRVIGVNGSRWLLRATLLGRPAIDPEAATTWEDAISGVVVRRGTGAMMVGEALPVSVPTGARRLS